MLSTKQKVATAKLLVFSLGDLHLALRLEGVQKVIKMPQIFKSGDKFLGITQFENRDVIVLDLYRHIYGAPATHQKGHLIIVRAAENTFGLAVDTLPTMVDIPLSAFCPVSNDFRDRDSLGISESMVEITLHKDQKTMAFLLDSSLLLGLAENCQP
jgi:chemotaxis signal transduction protein